MQQSQYQRLRRPQGCMALTFTNRLTIDTVAYVNSSVSAVLVYNPYVCRPTAHGTLAQMRKHIKAKPHHHPAAPSVTHLLRCHASEAEHTNLLCDEGPVLSRVALL